MSAVWRIRSQKGGFLVQVLDINSEGAAKTAADIRNADGKAHYFKLDVTD